MISSLLKVLRRGSHLIVALRFDVVDLITTVEPLTNIGKVLLHEIDILVVILHIDSWIPDQANSEAMEALSNFLALIYGSFGRVFILSCAQIKIQVDYRHFFKFIISNYLLTF